MKSIGEQAKEFRETQGWNYTRMAEEVSKHHAQPVSRQLITQLEEKGDRRPHYLAALATTMRITVDDLLAGKYQAQQGAAEERQPYAVEISPEYAGRQKGTLRNVPVVGTARMGDDGYYDELSTEVGAGDGHVEIQTADPNAYCLRVRGSSMHPAIRDGWYVVVEPNSPLALGEYVLVKLANGQKMVKELLYQRQGSIEITSVNGDQRRTIYSDEYTEIQAVGAVVPPSKWMPDL